MDSRNKNILTHYNELLKIVRNFGRTKCIKDDYLGIVLVSFFQRFLEHSKSVHSLSKSRDHLLIARSIIEGGLILKWILQPNDMTIQNERAEDYLVLSKFLARYQRVCAMGDKADPKYKEALRAELLKDGYRLTKSLYKNIESGLPLPFDAYVKMLTGMSLKKLIETIDSLDPDIYYRNYGYMSGFHHWNSFYMSIKYANGQSTYGGETDKEAEYELSAMTALFVFAETAKQLSQHYQLEKEEKIKDIVLGLVKSLGKRNRKKKRTSVK